MDKHLSFEKCIFKNKHFLEIKRFDTDIYQAMAYDELIFHQSIVNNKNYLRLYKVIKPSVTIGYSIRTDKLEFDLPWTRRITGGGIVEHYNDIIFLLSFSAENISAAKIYKIIHNNLRAFLSQFIPDIKIIDKSEKRGDLCFQNPVESDLIYNDTKITGGALKKKGNNFLYQGSIQVNEYQEDILNSTDSLKDYFGIRYSDSIKIDEFTDIKSELNLNDKYSSEKWKKLR